MSSEKSGKPRHIAASTLAALGIVFGDIGTSPLYAFRECFRDHSGSAPISPENLVGAASLIVWALMSIISIKYIFLILRFDNKGEGGILALAALIRGAAGSLSPKKRGYILLAGIFGSALIYADGILTPAISVLSAVEGLSVSAPGLAHWTVPIAVGILLALFTIQQFGTQRVGLLFGPVVLVWFGTLAVLGISGIMKEPSVIFALSPTQGFLFLVREWDHALPLLAAVFLAVTGGEALYADLGHFGTRPIRCGWFTIVMPALVLNYLGQAALLTVDPTAIRSPFFLLAPSFFQLPLTILATCAAVVASQALISGAFSLTAQAIRIAILPRITVRHTSEDSVGQVYVPFVNWLFAALCIILVIGFGSSSALASAYGIAIALTMFITTLLFQFAATYVWKWPFARAAALTLVFLAIDSMFLFANLTKIADGGWLPLAIAAFVSSLMLIWLWGRHRLAIRMGRMALDRDLFIAELENHRIQRVKGIAIYMTGHPGRIPNALLHNLKHNQVAHQTILLLHVSTTDEPTIPWEERLQSTALSSGVHCVTVRFGFSDVPALPRLLKENLPAEILFNPDKATYFLGRETYRVGKTATLLDRIRLSIFAVLARNASPATAHFQLPPNRVVELGGQLTL